MNETNRGVPCVMFVMWLMKIRDTFECAPFSRVPHFRWCPIFPKKGAPKKNGAPTKVFHFFVSFFGAPTKKGAPSKMGHPRKWGTNKNGAPTKIIYAVSVIT